MEFISEATIQVLVGGDGSSFTTNHIAERAGISVGTLYRYFPDKGAILRFVVRREIKRTSAFVLAVVETSGANSADKLVRDVIEASLTAFNRRAKATIAIRELAQKDDQLLSEMLDLRLAIVKRLHHRLQVLEPERFGSISSEELDAAGEAYRAALLKLSSAEQV
ncbi:TetR/AcrR family transcriptional regulator [Pseudooctadecabacter jejudonensis]|uniref:Transcriptional regulator BetI n=1 Tax=Pseudooctadecabacter jejudonensis TaxID=1391910 RepID=A0A1Y5SXA9_9RHOB|nr:TetR/AcrR family transcriptional regulator [Pseudooctadecabacter jejudonensis]SLN47264.1 transcriptional regulator BetI [Pseudooctadecabacter jejudonensis]